MTVRDLFLIQMSHSTPSIILYFYNNLWNLYANFNTKASKNKVSYPSFRNKFLTILCPLVYELQPYFFLHLEEWKWHK